MMKDDKQHSALEEEGVTKLKNPIQVNHMACKGKRDLSKNLLRCGVERDMRLHILLRTTDFVVTK